MGQHAKPLHMRQEGQIDQANSVAHPVGPVAQRAEALMLHRQQGVGQPGGQSGLGVGTLGQHQLVDERGETNIGKINPDPCLSPACRIARQHRACRKHVFEVFVDHGRFENHHAVMAQHRHLAIRRNLQKPVGLVIEIDGGEIKLDPLLDQRHASALGKGTG